jgi:uncharacterized protein (DUF1697 family)
MPRYLAFLRAINVGGHVVRMERLRELLAAAGFERVETFIASGNVLFDTRSRSAAAIERRIETVLADALGYEVATFVRTPADVAALASGRPFPAARLAATTALSVAFLKAAPDAAARRRLAALATEIDALRTDGREVYWSSLRKQSESLVSGAALEKALGAPTTLRSMSTIQKLVERYGLGPS